MEYVFSDFFGHCKVDLAEGAMQVATKPRLGSSRLESHAMDTIWPVAVQAQFSNWQRSALMLPGLLALTAVLIEAYALSKASIGLYIALLMLAFAMMFFGAWFGTVLRFITVGLKNGNEALRVVHTASNEAAMASLIDVLKAQSPKEPEVVVAGQAFSESQHAPPDLTACFFLQPADQAQTTRFWNMRPGAAEAAFPLALLIIYWLLGLAAWAAFETWVRKHNPDILGMFAGAGALIAALFITTVQDKRKKRAKTETAIKSGTPDTHVRLTPKAITHDSPTHTVVLPWQHIHHLKVEECGIAVYHTAWLLFIPARAFTDANHRAAFINGIINYAPHLNAEVQLTGQKPVPAIS